jgi:Mg2+-importing ATPase
MGAMAALDNARAPSTGMDWRSLTLASAAALSADEVLGRVESTADGLSHDEARARLAQIGANALRSHGARPCAVLARQLRNPLLILLVAAAVASFAVGERTSALIILLIIGMSVGLGFFNEYRSELAVEALHSQLRHTALAVRDGEPVAVDVTELVPGDVVRLAVGDVVPADLRLLRVDGLECDEAVLTGESLPAEKRSNPITVPESSLDLASCAFMGTVVREGSGLGVVVRTGGRTEFGAIALQLGERQPQTAFQLGLRDFSLLLVRVTAVLAGSILVINVVLGRSLLGSVLFALAIAVGLTPQLLPAIVTISLSTGAKRLAEGKVVVKRLVSIEDLGNIVVLFTDKTGTLTEGHITFAAALDAEGRPSDAVLRAGLLCNDASFSDGQVVGWQPARSGAVAGAGRPQRRRGASSPCGRSALRLPAAPGIGPGRAGRPAAGDRQGRTRDRARTMLEPRPRSAGRAGPTVRRRQPRDCRRDAPRRGPHDPERRGRARP